MKLGVNIDHIATLRNARGMNNPSLLRALEVCHKTKVDILTVHLREDRRHINDKDLVLLKKNSLIPINLEMALTQEMISIANKIKPQFICLVPEKRNELTTEGGLNLKKNKENIKSIINRFKKLKIRTSLFINPNLKDISLSKKLGSDCVEIHTGTFSNLVKSKKKYSKEFLKIKKCSNLAKSIGLEVHAGHGLDYHSTKLLCKISEIEEFNIGHFIIGESIFYGLDKVIKNFKKIIN